MYSSVFSLADEIERNAQRYAALDAFVCGERRITHAEFLARSRKVASAWHGLGLRRQDRVSVLAQNCPEFLEIYGAGELAGYITATVNFRLAPPEMAYVISDASPKVLVFESEYGDTIERIRGQLRSVEHFVCIARDGGDIPSWAVAYDTLIAGAGAEGPPCRARASDIAYLIYTSGTTGRPKGCMISHAAARSWAHIMALAHESNAADRMLLVMPFFHVGAKFMQLSQHSVGGTVYVHRGFDADAVLRCVAEDRVTALHMAPTLVQTLLEHPQLSQCDISSLRTIVYGAAPMPLPVLRKGLAMLGPVFIQVYGQTETMGTNLARHEHCPDGTEVQRNWLRSIGRPPVNCELRILADNGLECPNGKPGEIVIRSPGQFSGYWNNTAASIETLRDGWVHTGDIGQVDDQGFVYLVDRKKDVIISGGENIYSREVEEAIASHPAVSECAVIGIPDEKWGESVCAVVVVASGHSLDADAVIAHCRQQIASYKKPKRVVFMDALPRLPSGKISKVELRKLYAQR
jgi:acyl-CoA synthetase (AMP-forming)/AMP-acid ligase II